MHSLPLTFDTHMNLDSMISWLANQVAKLSFPGHGPAKTEVESLMKEILSFDAVFSVAQEAEYKFVLARICEASFRSGDRLVLMDCLHYAFAPANPGKEWRTIFNGLRILNSLIDSGSVAIFREVSEGKHFDLVQKSLFLISYSSSDDRITKLIRSTARDLRDKLLAKFAQLDDETSATDDGKKTSISHRDSLAVPIPHSSVSHLVQLRHVEDSSEDDSECNETPSMIPPETVDLLDLNCTVSDHPHNR